MAAPSVTIKEKQSMLKDQNAKDLTQYIKKRNNLEREMSYHCYFVAFLDMKAIARNNQDIDHREGNAMNTKLLFHNIVISLLHRIEDSLISVY